MRRGVRPFLRQLLRKFLRRGRVLAVLRAASRAVCVLPGVLVPEPVLAGEAVRDFAPNPRFGLVFVYAAQCPASQRIAPAVRTVSRHHTLPVLAISTDGLRLPHWPETQPDRGQLSRLGLTRVPLIALYDSAAVSQDGRLRVVASHALNASALDHRIITLMGEAL